MEIPANCLLLLLDYAKELSEISRALQQLVKVSSHQPVSPWVLAAFSVFLGILGGIIGRLIEPYLADVYRRGKMRRVLYADVYDLFSHLDSVIDINDPTRHNEQYTS